MIMAGLVVKYHVLTKLSHHEGQNLRGGVPTTRDVVCNRTSSDSFVRDDHGLVVRYHVLTVVYSSIYIVVYL